MKFGKTIEQRWKERSDTLQLWRTIGIRKFALLPTKMEDGSWLWLESYLSFIDDRDQHKLIQNGGSLLWFQITGRFRNVAAQDEIVRRLKG